LKSSRVGSSLARHFVLQDANPIDRELDRVASLKKRPISSPQQLPTAPEPKTSPA
jgi:hypothetical protein